MISKHQQPRFVIDYQSLTKRTQSFSSHLLKVNLNCKTELNKLKPIWCAQLSKVCVPYEQRLHFRSVSWRTKSSLCRQPFKSVQKSGRINHKNGFFPLLGRFRALRESCVADQSCRNFLFQRNSRHLTTNLKVNFACEWRDEFCACTIENWTVVGRGYFSQSQASSHSENVASVRRVRFVRLWGSIL